MTAILQRVVITVFVKAFFKNIGKQFSLSARYIIAPPLAKGVAVSLYQRRLLFIQLN